MSRIDRRALFASGAAAALLAATGTLEAAPRRGGTLRLALPREGAMLESLARSAVYDTLTEIGPDGVLKGELATQWSSSPDARVWHFDLRQDVRFHDGTLLSAEDVIASLEARAMPVEILGLRAVAAHRIKLELGVPNSDFPYLLADPAFFVARAGQVQSPLEGANGTGLYQVTDYQPGRQFRAERLEPHYKDGQAGWVDRVEAVVILDADVRSEALRDGFVDVAALPTPEGLVKRGAFTYHPSVQDIALAASTQVGMPTRIGTRAPLDDGRIAERWWVV